MRELMRHRDFRLLMTGQTLSMFGDTAMLLTLGMWAKDLTGSSPAFAGPPESSKAMTPWTGAPG
jgi:hypothetical protein